MKKKINPYKVLGITRATETPALVKQMCKELRLKEHPDKGGDPEKFDLIQKVCKILLDTQTLTKKSGNDKDKGEAVKKPVKDMTPEEQFELFKKTKPSQLNVSRYLANLFLDSTGGTKQKDITMWATLKGLKDVDKILQSKSKANKTKRDALIAGLKEFVKLAKDEGWKTINAPTDHYDFLGEEQDFQNPQYDIGDISNRELMEIIELVGKYLGVKVDYDISKVGADVAGKISGDGRWGGTIFSFGDKKVGRPVGSKTILNFSKLKKEELTQLLIKGLKASDFHAGNQTMKDGREILKSLFTGEDFKLKAKITEEEYKKLSKAEQFFYATIFKEEKKAETIYQVVAGYKLRDKELIGKDRNYFTDEINKFMNSQ
tara:strand:+ start:1 stop:1122 length:1122 start_codon:yes stop_codon:yes gene_type:complete